MNAERNREMAEGLRKLADEKKITIVGMCVFGIGDTKAVDSLILFPQPNEMADVGTEKERIGIAVRFVKLVSASGKQFLRGMLASFGLPQDEKHGEQVDEAIRQELERLRVVDVPRGS